MLRTVCDAALNDLGDFDQRPVLRSARSKVPDSRFCNVMDVADYAEHEADRVKAEYTDDQVQG